MPDIKGARILVIGGTGFAGSHIVDKLTQEPVRKIVVLDNFEIHYRFWRGANLSCWETATPRVTLYKF